MTIEHEEEGRKGAFYICDSEARIGQLDYRLRGDRMVITHTEVDPRFQGEGLGQDLVHAAVDHARSLQLSVDPVCPYAKKVIESEGSA